MPDNLERSVVRFFYRNGENPAGTGFLISDRRILTCAHVIKDALDRDVDDSPAEGDQVQFDFPLLGLIGSHRNKLSGKACFWLSPDGEDLAVIEILGELPAEARPAPLLDVAVEELAGHDFDTYGFSAELTEGGGWAGGEIVGKTGTGLVQLKRKSVTDYFIKEGFSGGAIWDKTLNGVVGMSTAYLDASDSSTAYMMPTSTLLSGWRDQIQPSLVIPIVGEYAAVLRGYTQELLAGYLEYWEHFVSSMGSSGPSDLEALRPVGQIFQSQILLPRPPGPRNDQTHDRDDRPVPTQKETELPLGEQILVHSSLASICSTIFSATGRRFLLLNGDPGAGKTLSMRHLLAEQAGMLQDFSGAIPIYLPLNRFQEGHTLDGFILQTLRADKELPYHQRLADLLERIIKSRGVILLMDGVNEMPGFSIKRSLQKNFISKVMEFSDRYPGRVRGILSSREGEFVQDSGLPIIRIKPFEELGIREAITLFAPAHAGEILALFRNEPVLQELVTNPFRLKALCQTYLPGMRIPRTPGALYRTFIDALEMRELARHANPKSLKGWKNRFSELAFRMSERSALGVKKKELLGILKPSVLSFGLSTGLLLRSADEYKFVHQQIQEYFSALHLAELAVSGEAGSQRLTGLSRKRFWDETFHLLTDLLPDEALEPVLDAMIPGDIFLAARCAGMVHQRLPAAAREKLASALEQLLVSSRSHHNDEILEKTLAALGETRLPEAFAVLVKNNRDDDLYAWAGAALVNAIARIDIPEAADWLASELLKKTTPGRRQTTQEEYLVFTSALASMQTPEARGFLFAHIQHPQLYAAVLQALDEKRIQEDLASYQDLVTGLGINLKADLPGSAFTHLCSIAGHSGITELVPAFLRHAYQPAAARTLVRLDAGQAMIDACTSMLRYCLHFMERQKDLAVFDVRMVDARHLMTWAHLQTYHGSQAAEEYIQLLQHCVKNAATASDLEQVVGTLAMLDSHESISLIEGRRNHGEPSIREKLEHVIRMLETPGSYGIHKKTLEKMAVLICVEDKRTSGPLSATHPRDAIRNLLQDPSTLREQIRRILGQPNTRWKFFQRDHYDLLLNLNEYGAVPMLVDDLFQASRSLYRDSEYTLRVVSALIELGQKDPGKRVQIIQLMGPLLLHTDRRLQVSAIEILSGLGANDHCGQLLQFLSDQTWEIAYTIADHFGAMDPGGDYAGRLEERLISSVPGQKYFALLALGSLKRASSVPAILKHWRDSFEFNERAALWALAEIGEADNGVNTAIVEGMSSRHGWVRLEAARSAGMLELTVHSQRLVDLLDDPDLRVVEQAAIALGRLKDPAAFPFLKRALKRAPLPLQYYHERVWRVEDRLRGILAAACIACSPENTDLDFDPGMDGDKPGMTQALLTGEMQRGCFPASADKRPAAAPKASSPDGDPEQVILNSADPQARRQAGELLRERGTNKIPNDVRRDPNPFVSLQYFLDTGTVSDPAHFTGIPGFDLGIAAGLKDQKPTLLLKIQNDWEGAYSETSSAALELATLFPDRYRNSDLLDVLLEIGERTNLPVKSAVLLAQALEKRDLPRFMRNSRAFNWYGHQGHSQLREALEVLALRRTWSMVHDLVTYLDNRTARSDGHAGFFLAGLGVYQAAGWVQKQMRPYDRNEILEIIVQADLLGQTPSPVEEDARARSNYQGKLDVVFANLCCQSNGEDAVRAWGRTVGYRFYEADDAWINRGLRKWGIQAVREMVNKQGYRDLDPVVEFSAALVGFKGRRSYYRKLFNELDHELVIGMIDAESEEYFREWISAESAGLQVMGLAALMRKRSPLLVDGLPDLFSHLSAASVLFLFEAAEAGRLPGLMNLILELQEPARPVNNFLIAYFEELMQGEPAAEEIQLVEVIGQYRLQALAEPLKARLTACDGSIADHVEAIITALVRLDRVESTQHIQRFLNAEHPRLAAAALEALLALRVPLMDELLERLLSVDHSEVRGLTYLICAINGRASLSGRIHEHYLAMLQVQELISKKNFTIPSDLTEMIGLPSLKIGTSSDQRELEELIHTTALSLYLLGRLDRFKFPYQLDGLAGTGLLAFYFITMIFSDRYDYGTWRNTSLRADWLRIFPAGDVVKMIELDLDKVQWLTQSDKSFILGWTANALPELTVSLQQDPDQAELRSKRQASLEGYLKGMGYSVQNCAEFIEQAAECATAEAHRVLCGLSGFEEPIRQIHAWRAELQRIETEEQFKSIDWQLIEHSCFLWSLERIGGVLEQNEFTSSLDSAIAYSILSTEDGGNGEPVIADLISAHKARSLELRQEILRIMNVCDARDMIHLLGMDMMNVFDPTQEDSQARQWIKKWRPLPQSMREEALEKSRGKTDDGQKADPFELALEQKRRRVVSGV